MRALRWIPALFLAALALPLYRTLTGPAGHWPLHLIAAHAAGGAVLLFAVSGAVPQFVFDVRRLRGNRQPYPYGMWAVLLAGLVALAAYGG